MAWQEDPGLGVRRPWFKPQFCHKPALGKSPQLSEPLILWRKMGRMDSMLKLHVQWSLNGSLWLNPTLSLSGWVSLGKLLNLSRPSFLHLKNENISVTSLHRVSVRLTGNSANNDPLSQSPSVKTGHILRVQSLLLASFFPPAIFPVCVFPDS